MSTESAYPFVNTYGSNRMQITKGKKCFVWDKGGTRYLDFFSGIAVNALGYGNKEIARAIAQQYCRLPHISNLYTTSLSDQLAREILSHQAIANRSYQGLFFSNSGAEANEAALKFAALYIKNMHNRTPTFASFKNGFHGRSFLNLALTANKKYSAMYKGILPSVEAIPYNNLGALREKLTERVGAVIVEVVQGEGGMMTLNAESALLLNRVCKSNDIVLIADEVQTGLGRTGSVYASEQIGLKPDIITIAKPLAGGLPLGATIVTEKINTHITPALHGSTFGGGPIPCAAARLVWKRVTRHSFLQSVRTAASHLDELLQKLKSNHPCVRELRGMGLLRGITMKKDIDINDVLTRARQSGLLLARSGEDTIRLAPPLVISKSEVSLAINILDQLLAAY